MATNKRSSVRKRGSVSGRVTMVETRKAETRSTEVLDLFATHEGTLPGGALAPPYDFKKLYILFEQSSILRPNIDAYVTNIDSFGYHLVPTIDLSSDSAKLRVSDAMYYEAMLEAHEKGEDITAVQPPTDDQVLQRIDQLQKVARFEETRLTSFFESVSPQLSFTELRRRSRQDLEVLGNAFWEVVRNALGEIVHIYYVNPINMRLCPEEKEPITVDEVYKVTPITRRTRQLKRHFRHFVKLGPRRETTFFKEFGDPRIVSRKTGKVYRDPEQFAAKEPGAIAATEILHFAVFTPHSVYGVPRWIANLPAVMGSRELDEVNLNYFKHNVVPPLALLVSGGRLGKGVASKIEEFIETHLKGKKSAHRILVLEAESQKTQTGDSPKAVPKVMFVPLRDAQQNDALFQNYDARNEEKLARSFRLPRILRGDDTKTNRATAFAALKFAEEQVFEPERELFDSAINRRLFPDLSVVFFIFRSNSPIARDPDAMSDMIINMVKAGIITLAEARELASDVFNTQFAKISEEWTGKPLPFLLAQLHTGATLEELGIGSSSLPRLARPDAIEPPEPDHNMPQVPTAIRRAGTPIPGMGIGIEENET